LDHLDTEKYRQLWNRLYNLSFQMLGNPELSEEAVQDIFLKILEKQETFRGDSAFQTWAYSLARNYLIDRIRQTSRKSLRFEDFQEELHHFEPYKGELGLTREEEQLYTEEVKVGCTTAMLQCLNAEDRYLFVLSSIFGLSSKDASEICGLTPETCRKRLSRLKKKMLSFMNAHCGLLNPQAECQCRKRLTIALDRGRINPEKLLYQSENPRIHEMQRQLNTLDQVAAVYRDNPYFNDVQGIQHFLKQQESLFQE